ncbi:pyridoxamine 5'-phosphate oxidase [Amycolatopsis mediterranei S699]|uniref:Pyridoxamine 5'-phosphate oxidase n=2 Tax=Amycolatopsis mediterranei TaxID=33910 RepID=A0A0H3DIT8_AMYMU|nr:TIGR03618 family F420-dependent PPOX class oxidoreductase [Amycolatopsis mediterranei]ADJ50606.1 pyridoxamine 5'-phosphate oxidase [Amycolatopsis mediterranei U32]AEK47612.1 pyridoxamine 5'-phosphate oxidase [Amycolatopsis mediterranei S699]AFO82312.1 pyridoxamine 5'-phosphate oxidase [Amycolatopsis mediterranei S699]AGT89441.1 pyridoxamine 5'-phosphate oxidase [Amycolatopsis mediterranei RB]KDO09292.1 pyridoxamine 5'-phosphate oxidase [Amycolatopsis mediterranei]
MELPESCHRLFERPFNAVLTTVDPDGSPQTSMVWASREGDEIVMGMEGRRPKVRNIRNDPRVTVLIEDHDERDARGLPQYLLVRGTARVTGPDIAAEFTALMDRQARRYLGAEKYELGNQGSPTGVIVRITADRVTGIGPWAS